MTTYDKIRMLLRLDNDYAISILVQQAMNLGKEVTEAQVAWVAEMIHVKREYITNGEPILSVDELDSEDVEYDWDYDEVVKEYPEIAEWRNRFVATYLLFKRTKRVAFRSEEFEPIERNLIAEIKKYAREVLEENNMLNN